MMRRPSRIPFLGVRPFDEADEPLFFGREPQINATLGKLEDHCFLAVVGSSGCGKSSFVRAGLLPAIRQGFLGGTDDWLIVVMKPGQDPYRGLARAIDAALGSHIPNDELLRVLCSSDAGLLDVLTNLGAREEMGVFLVVDQFEELFAFRRENERRDEVVVRDRAAAFVRMLLTSSAGSRRRLRTVLTLRSDFIGDADAFLGLPEAISESQLLVPRLTRHQMEEVIVRPATVADAGFQTFTFDEHLVNRIINDAGDRPDQLPLMQHALMRTWKRAVGRAQNREAVRLTHDDYQQVGTISRALSLDAEEAWRQVAREERLARVARELFLQLCDISAEGKVTRRRPTIGDAQRAIGASREDLGAVLTPFQENDRNFVTPTWQPGLAADDVLDISHESLVRQWSRFKGWVGDQATAVAEKTRLRESAETRQVIRAAAGALRVSVVNGDLTFVSQPLMVGHYHSSRLTGSEAVANASVGGAMAASLHYGLYPDAPGTHSIFAASSRAAIAEPLRRLPPPAVIVVGLGQEGRLRPGALTASVRQGVVAWAQRVSETAPEQTAFDLTATLVGSGGAGISVAQSAQWLVQAVQGANQLLAEHVARGQPLPRVGHFRIVELYHDRAIEAWRALNVLAAAVTGQFAIERLVQSEPGALRYSSDLGYRGVDYDYLSASSSQGHSGLPGISFVFDTKRARSEVRAESARTDLLTRLLEQASNDPDAGPEIGRTLFKLLVPIEVEPFFAGSADTRLEVDEGTASIPWELLLDGNTPDARPWAIRTRLVRLLRTDSVRPQVVDSDPEMNALIIGEPASDVRLYPRLPGAREEAWAIAERLKQGMPDATIGELFSHDANPGPDARNVVNALLERSWRIVHIAGHAEMHSGVILSDGAFLGPREFRAMRVLPELVFVNCAYRPAEWPVAVDGAAGAGKPGTNWPLFAATFAAPLIELGVRCVVATGWTVEDAPAREFAVRFYTALVKGRRFVDAVAEAREAAFALGGETWAAYQCYGDPDWQLRRSDDAGSARLERADLGFVASAEELKGALDTISVRSQYQQVDPQRQRAELVGLEQQFGEGLGGHGDVAEAFAGAWASVPDFDRAISWYERALGAADGTASMQAVQRLGNLRVRRVWQNYASGNVTVQGVRTQIEATIAELEALLARYPTTERAALLGSAYRRLAMLEEIANRPLAVTRALGGMQRHYGHAVEMSSQPAELLFVLLNYMAADLLLHGRDAKWKGFAGPGTADAIRTVERHVQASPDFWAVAGGIELGIYQRISRRRLSPDVSGIAEQLSGLHAHIDQPQWWASAVEQLRWVIRDYAARTTGAEKKAATTLLNRVAELTGGEPEVRPPRARRGQKRSRK